MARRKVQDKGADLARAQDLIYDAWEAPTLECKVEFAFAALAISRLCADAYSLLAQHAKPGSHEELDLWRLGVEAGRKAIGEAAFKEYAGELWGFLEARPYMRTRFGLAEALWKRGRHEEAVDDLSELLALNPNDNQGIRYALLAHLAEMRRDDETAALLGRYGDEYSAFWAWTRVLLAFRRSGDDAAACAQLGEAVKVNPHVRDYLCGERRVPREMPPYYGPGDKDEAILYVADYRLAWQETPGAVDWLKTKAPTTLKTRRRAARKH